MLVPEGRTGSLTPERTVASRMLSVRPPPPFLDKICCLLGLLGEPSDSGQNPGFDGLAQSREIISDSRTVSGQGFRDVPDPTSWLLTTIFPLPYLVHTQKIRRICPLAFASARLE